MFSTERRLLGRVGNLLVAAALLATFGCGTADGTQSHARNNTSDPQLVTSGSRVKLYSSLAELATDVDGVALVTVSGDDPSTVPADEAGTSEIMAEVTSARVDRLLRGSLPETVEIRLITSPEDGSDMPPPLKSGGTYVLFLDQFEFKPGEPTGQYTVPGGAGIYLTDSQNRLTLISRGADKLPASLPSVEALQELLSAK